ncbi:MAG TPA: LysR family transcriptional regulator [Kofleriaceae bacterium]|jgi:DNA-binding transcriptional LysR family regulator|nr:LysR family transcriptional regulator [Kofleriaceae bacterium]
MRELNLDYLRAFVDVIERGSFTAAAHSLGLTQPAVSLQVRQLEARLGVRLVERVGRTARPTAAGAELLEHARQIEAAVSTALDRMASHATGALGRVRLGTGATACTFLLPPLLRDLRRRFPTLEITVTTSNAPDIIKAVDDNLIDVGLVTLPAAGRMLEITPVLDDEFVAIAPPELQLPTPVTAAALATRPVLLFEPAGNTRRLIDAWLARARVALQPVMSLGSVETVKQLVAAGLGCAILTRMSVSSARDRGDLVVRSLAPRVHRTLAVVVRRDKPLTRGLRETVRGLKALARTAPRPRGDAG